MLSIIDDVAMARVLDSPLDPVLKRLLAARRDQLLRDTDGEYKLGELAQFLVIEPPDLVAEIEAVAGLPLITSPAFEWGTDHGSWLEVGSVITDWGFGIVLLVPVCGGVDPQILSTARNVIVRETDRGGSLDQDEHPQTTQT
jgi:hypothetical protein